MIFIFLFLDSLKIFVRWTTFVGGRLGTTTKDGIWLVSLLIFDNYLMNGVHHCGRILVGGKNKFKCVRIIDSEYIELAGT